MRFAKAPGVAEIIVGVVEGQEAFVVSRLSDAQLYYSGGRGVVEGRAAEALRALAERLGKPFVLESGRVGLADCRLVAKPRPPAHADGVTFRMPNVRLSRPALSFTYASTYDPDEMDSLRPPP